MVEKSHADIRKIVSVTVKTASPKGRFEALTDKTQILKGWVEGWDGV